MLELLIFLSQLVILDHVFPLFLRDVQCFQSKSLKSTIATLGILELSIYFLFAQNDNYVKSRFSN